MPGSEINFLMRAPTGEQVQIFGCQRGNLGRQKFPLLFFLISLNKNKKCMVWTFLRSIIALLPLSIPENTLNVTGSEL